MRKRERMDDGNMILRDGKQKEKEEGRMQDKHVTSPTGGVMCKCRCTTKSFFDDERQ